MLVQVFCKDKTDVETAVRMIYNHFRNDIEFIQVDYVRKISEGPYFAEPFETVQEAIDRMAEKANIDTDNVAVYYNSGQKIFVRIFEMVKVDPEACQ